MAIPGPIKGAGNNSTAQNVIKVTFSEATADAPKLKAWDDFSVNSVTHEIFTGTTGNGNKPMLSAVATTNGAPASAWKPSAATSGGATINRLKGDDSYVNLDTGAVAKDGNVRFNLCLELPYDASVPGDLDWVLTLEYTYSGPAPLLTWEFNDEDGGGTEATPVWTQLDAGASGDCLRPADANCAASNIVLHKPPSGTLDNPALWVDNI